MWWFLSRAVYLGVNPNIIMSFLKAVLLGRHALGLCTHVLARAVYLALAL